jgi:hypothetical protein
MTTDFATLTTPHLEAPGRYHADVPDGWQQGRGAFGRLVLALVRVPARWPAAVQRRASSGGERLDSPEPAGARP